MDADEIRVYILICAGCYMALKLVTRWAWYRPSHRRPGFLRHAFTIRTLDLVAMLFLVGTFFMMINLERWGGTILVMAALIVYDVLLRMIFLHAEARFTRAHSHHTNMKHIKRRLRGRARQESPF